MIDQQLARLRTHRSNIQRYRNLLQTSLTELERLVCPKAPERRAIQSGEGGHFPSQRGEGRPASSGLAKRYASPSGLKCCHRPATRGMFRFLEH